MNYDNELIHTDTCLYMLIHLCTQKIEQNTYIHTQYKQIHSYTCAYMHIQTDVFCMYCACISVCMSSLYLYVFVCIACICLYFLHEKLLVALIQTHSARYIQYRSNTYQIQQKYIVNTDKYWQIHTKKIKNPCFSRPFFRVCIWSVFVCIVCI